MKKIFSLMTLAALLFGLSGIAAQAETGDMAGHIYSTDIRAFINGVEVPSYNIGGKTAVVIEDITDYTYSDEHRLLKISSGFGCFKPDSIYGASSEGAEEPGKIMGDIYETDIKTLVYDTEIPSYNIGGKTAVAIEDLGNNNEFSELGGKYVWDETDRTIRLEFAYSNMNAEIMKTKMVSMELTVNNDWTEATAEFIRDKIDPSDVNVHYDHERDDPTQPMLMPVYTDIEGEKTVLGYIFHHKDKRFTYNEDNKLELDNDDQSFYYFYEDIIERALDKTDIPTMTKEDVIQYYLAHYVNKVNDRFDTDDYSFLYMGFYGTPHGGASIYLLRVDNDGNTHNYLDDLWDISYGRGTELEDVTIDKENEKVYVEYEGSHVIDLKTGAFYPEDKYEEPYVSTHESGYIGRPYAYPEIEAIGSGYVSNTSSVGEIAGDMYYTDIKTYVFDAPITSYNIGGRTVIDTEILSGYYGFDVLWNEDTHRLDVTNKGTSASQRALNGELVESSEGAIGDIAGHYYTTDIVTTLNGKPIEAYNIGGRTFLVAESMRDYGYNVEWNEEARELRVTKDPPLSFIYEENGASKLKTDYGDLNVYQLSEYDGYCTPTKGSLFFHKRNEQGNYRLPLNSGKAENWGGAYYVKLHDIEEILGAKCYIETKPSDEGYTYTLNIDYDTSNIPPLKKVADTEEDLWAGDTLSKGSAKFDSQYSITADFRANGKEVNMVKGWGGWHDFNFHFLVLNGEVWMPTNPLPAIFGYSYR